MATKFKYTFYEDKHKVASCVVISAQNGAFERLIRKMVRMSKRHNCLVEYESIKIETE